MSKADKFRQFSIRIPALLVEYVDAEAKKNGRSRNKQVATMIDRFRAAGLGLEPVSRAELNHYLSQINAQLRAVVNEAVKAHAEAVKANAATKQKEMTHKLDEISRLNCRIPLSILKEIDRAAEEAGISRRVQVERILREWCELNPEKIGDRLYRVPESRFKKQ
jgi:predicted HicB family RNase H-like nuclease